MKFGGRKNNINTNKLQNVSEDYYYDKRDDSHFKIVNYLSLDGDVPVFPS